MSIGEVCAGVYFDMPELVYHADPIDGGSLSSTGAKNILKSPAHYQWSLHNRKETAAFDTGHILHSLILGTGLEIEILDFDSFRSKEAREARDMARAEGKVPVIASDFEPLKTVADTVLGSTIGDVFTSEGDSEVSIFAPDEVSGVMMRGRIDRVVKTDRGWLLVDLKSVQDTDPREFTRTAQNYRYDLQKRWYERIWRALHPGENIEFAHVLIPKNLDGPILPTIVWLDRDFDHTGDIQANRALSVYKHCVETGEWGGYPQNQVLGPRAYYVGDIEELENQNA